ncbi:MAG: peptidoglycan DD-metalloendopeptidase family protein [Bacillota bacterium]|nr:peptidoglycan DD-metalloendopeptidase family protein [Bacillota bacterium]
MRKLFVTITVAAIVGAGSLFGGFSVKTEAASVSSLKKQQSQIQNQKSNIQSNINGANQKIANLQGQQNDVTNQMQKIDFAIGDTDSKIHSKSVKLDETKKAIVKLQGDIQVIMARIQKRNELLKDRARNYQETGGVVSYLDVLMGSSSISDFIDRANAVATIMEADQEIINQAEADKKELEQKQGQVKRDFEHVQKMLQELQSMKQQLNTQMAQKNQLLGTLKTQEKQVTEDKMSMEEQTQVLAAQEVSIQKAIKLEQERQAELARQAAAARNNSSSGSSSGSTPPISSGNFTRPADGVISSTYGPRWGEFHYGVDIANPGANVPIVAAADGVVAVSHYSTSYGNVVYITHSINGHIYTTVYAHMSERMVSEGQVVTKGQQIGIMGSTGEATGQHLHFELYDGPWKYHSAINPMGIVPL